MPPTSFSADRRSTSTRSISPKRPEVRYWPIATDIAPQRNVRVRGKADINQRVEIVDSAGDILFFPLHPILPLPSLPRIKLLAAETRHELLRIRRVGEAVDVEPLPIMADAVAARAQRQILAEVVDDFVAAVFTRACRQRDLVRPTAVDGGRR
jgi:hypothetical protein